MILSDYPTAMLVLQSLQILVGNHAPGDWPGPVTKRLQRQRAAVPEGSHREQAGQSLPGTHEEGESTCELVPSHPRKA